MSGQATAGEVSVAILGLGSRGLSVLERLVTLAKLAGPAAGPVRIEVVDPICTGAGVHGTGQPDYLMLNTTCAQVSMFPDACTVGADTDAPGPSLYEWVTERGLRLAPDGFTVGEAGRPIRPTDFLPRRMLGEYLGWFAGEVLRRVPDHVRVVLHRSEAVDVEPGPDGFAVALADGTRVHAGHVFLTTGYTPNDQGAGGPDGPVIAQPYPLPDRAADVGPGETVAIDGFGLSAMDLLSCLTVGRGGRFVGADGRAAGQGGSGGELRYLPSGREPTVLLHSRSGVPCRARPLVVRFGPPYQPLVLAPASIDALRIARGGPLDFDRDVLPLVLAEMRIAYRRCEARLAGPDAAQALERRLTDAVGMAALLDELDAELGPFDPWAAFDPSAEMLLDSSEAYQKWLAELVGRDLADGALGFAGSPVKAALDILRDLRDTFRYAVDFGGLTPGSLEQFIGRTVPLINRAVVGPQYERHAELLALMAAGVVAVPFGPAPAVERNPATGRWTITSTRLAEPCSRAVDWLASGHVAPPAVASSASPLLRALHRRGMVRRHRPGSRYVPGIDVDPDQHPLDAAGLPQRRMWVLGPLCEGATFYNNLVPSPSVRSRPILDAHRCAAALLAGRRSLAQPREAVAPP
ncbi:MAG: FAD/NAD(P)-binding protein [Frankiaceae bacterium]